VCVVTSLVYSSQLEDPGVTESAGRHPVEQDTARHTVEQEQARSTTLAIMPLIRLIKSVQKTRNSHLKLSARKESVSYDSD